jgi:hypothetical protein
VSTIRRATRLTLSALATDEPPYFCTTRLTRELPGSAGHGSPEDSQHSHADPFDIHGRSSLTKPPAYPSTRYPLPFGRPMGYGYEHSLMNKRSYDQEVPMPDIQIAALTKRFAAVEAVSGYVVLAAGVAIWTTVRRDVT